MTISTYLVDGMTCDHCVHAVTTEFSAIDGVSNVAVELRPGDASAVTVTSEAQLSGDDVTAALDEAGYELHA